MNWYWINAEDIDETHLGNNVIAISLLDELSSAWDTEAVCGCPCGCGQYFECFVGELRGFDEDSVEIGSFNLGIEDTTILVTGLDVSRLKTLIEITGSQIANYENPMVRLLALGLWHEMVNGIRDEELRGISMISLESGDDFDDNGLGSVTARWPG